jgi:HisJ family histidinol phosphate phosphatase
MPRTRKQPLSLLPSYDLHAHTVYCGHAADDATVRNMIARAVELGLDYFGISEHVFFADEAGAIFSIEHDIHQCEHGRTRVLLGVEVDPNPLKADGSWATHDLHVDYVILSPHMLPHSGLGAGECNAQRLSEQQKRRAGEQWLDWYARCIDHGGMDILGHPLREPITLGLIALREPAVLQRAIDVLAMAAARGVAFELNEAWLCNLLLTSQYEPYMDLMRELKRRGMKFSRGSDAHSPQSIGRCREIEHTARELGLTQNDWLDPAALAQAPDWEV